MSDPLRLPDPLRLSHNLAPYSILESSSMLDEQLPSLLPAAAAQLPPPPMSSGSGRLPRSRPPINANFRFFWSSYDWIAQTYFQGRLASPPPLARARLTIRGPHTNVRHRSPFLVWEARIFLSVAVHFFPKKVDDLFLVIVTFKRTVNVQTMDNPALPLALAHFPPPPGAPLLRLSFNQKLGHRRFCNEPCNIF